MISAKASPANKASAKMATALRMAVLFIYVHRQLGVFVIHVFPFVVGNNFAIGFFGRTLVYNDFILIVGIPATVFGTSSLSHFLKLLAGPVDAAEKAPDACNHHDDECNKKNEEEFQDKHIL
jgi:hypothetical protein